MQEKNVNILRIFSRSPFLPSKTYKKAHKNIQYFRSWKTPQFPGDIMTPF
jgi:hypothetical protein